MKKEVHKSRQDIVITAAGIGLGGFCLITLVHQFPHIPELLEAIISACLIAVFSIFVNLKILFNPRITAARKISQSILSSMTDGVVVQEPNGRLSSFNPSALKILGLTKQQAWALKTPFQNSSGPEAITKQPVTLVAEGGKPLANHLMQITRANGETIWIRVNATPREQEETSSGISVVVSFSDITDQMKAEQELTLTSQRLELVLDVSNLGSWEWCLTNNSVSLDRRWCEMLGLVYERTPQVFSTWGDLIHPDDVKKTMEDIQNHLDGRSPFFENTHRIRHSDGHWVWILARGRVSEVDQKGKPLRFSGTHLDISDQKRVEENLIEALAWQKAILNSTDYAVISTTENGTISTINQAAEKMLGYSASRLVGKKTPTLFHDASEVKAKLGLTSETAEVSFEQLLKAALKTGTSADSWTYISKTKTKIQVKLSVSAIRDRQGQNVGYLWIAEDVTENNKMKALIQSQQTQMMASAKLSSLGEMAGGVAHEINNPLAVIQGRTSQLLRLNQKNELTPEVLTKHLESINSTTMRIARIVKGLRTFSRGSEDDPFEPTPLRSTLEETVELCRDKFRANGVNLIVANVPDLTFPARATQISQVLLNLLNNACDAVEESIDKWVILEAFTTPLNQVEILITDSGPGIPPELEEKIMEPFFTTKGVGKGTGLGLSISRGIIENHGGKLMLDRSFSNTRFKITLPLGEIKKQAA